MPTQQATDLEQTLATFRRLLESHRDARNRLIERRANAGATEHSKLDQMIAINGRTLEALNAAARTVEEQLKQIEPLRPTDVSTRTTVTRM